MAGALYLICQVCYVGYAYGHVWCLVLSSTYDLLAKVAERSARFKRPGFIAASTYASNVSDKIYQMTATRRKKCPAKRSNENLSFFPVLATIIFIVMAGLKIGNENWTCGTEFVFLSCDIMKMLADRIKMKLELIFIKVENHSYETSWRVAPPRSPYRSHAE